MKHLFVSMSAKQNLYVSVFVHKCLMMLNDVEYTTFKMFVTQMGNYLFISFQLMFYKTLRYRLARTLPKANKSILLREMFFEHWGGGGGGGGCYSRKKLSVFQVVALPENSVSMERFYK